jgi:hypothetical protein
MPNTEDKGPDHAPNGDRRLSRNFTLLALPWLSFQRDMLAIMKKAIEDASHVRPIENLTLRELQALMMIFDPTGKWRGRLDHDLEKQIEEAYTKTFPKLISGSVHFIEAQEAFLASVSGLLEKLRKNKTSPDSPSNNANDGTKR